MDIIGIINLVGRIVGAWHLTELECDGWYVTEILTNSNRSDSNDLNVLTVSFLLLTSPVH